MFLISPYPYGNTLYLLLSLYKRVRLEPISPLMPVITTSISGSNGSVEDIFYLADECYKWVMGGKPITNDKNFGEAYLDECNECGGEQNDGQVRILGVFPKAFQNFQPVHFGHRYNISLK